MIAGLRAADVNLADGIVIGSLAVTAAALVSASIVMAADVGARAYVTRGTIATQPVNRAATDFQRARPTVWLRGEGKPCPVLGVERAADQTRYLVVRGTTSKKNVNGRDVEAYDDRPEWVPETDVIATSVE